MLGASAVTIESGSPYFLLVSVDNGINGHGWVFDLYLCTLLRAGPRAIIVRALNCRGSIRACSDSTRRLWQTWSAMVVLNVPFSVRLCVWRKPCWTLSQSLSKLPGDRWCCSTDRTHIFWHQGTHPFRRVIPSHQENHRSISWKRILAELCVCDRGCNEKHACHAPPIGI